MFSRKLVQLVGRTAIPKRAEDPKLIQALEAAKASPQDVQEVRMTALDDSLMAISWMPIFRFMPTWSPVHGTGTGKVTKVDGTRLYVVFDQSNPSPPMSWRTTFWNALWPTTVPALPPGFSIQIKSNKLEGWIDLSTGEVDLQFESDFGGMFGGGQKSSAPLKVHSRMTTETLEGNIFQAVGQRMRPDGYAKLVALSLVPKTPGLVQNLILQLPTDALSLLNVQFEFLLRSSTSGAKSSGPEAAAAATSATDSASVAASTARTR